MINSFKYKMTRLKIGILTASDRASSNVYEDISGKYILDYLREEYDEEFANLDIYYKVIPDELELIKMTIEEMIKEGCCLVLTTGGTGPSIRDVTSIATKQLIHKELPGFGEMMRKKSFENVPTAILSGQTAGICYSKEPGRPGIVDSVGTSSPLNFPDEPRKGTLIVNLPGSPKSIKECLSVVFPAIPYCIELMGWEWICSKTSWKPKK